MFPKALFGIVVGALLTASALSYTVAEQPAKQIENTLGMKLTLVPAGEFMMGAEEDPSDTLAAFPYARREWLDGETPQHRVKITKPFYMGTYEVTLGQFLQFYNAAKYKMDSETDGKPSWGYSADGKLIESNLFRPWNTLAWKTEMDHSAVYISWNDATAFCKWLSEKEKKTYRLPTEAEWEYACRAGTKTRFSNCNDPEDLVRIGNVADQDNRVGFENITIGVIEKGALENTQIPFPFLKGHDGYKWTAPVGKFRPNAFGLYDMHGNAWEWCSDWYDIKYYEKSPEEDPQGPTAGSERVLRGGGFGLSAVLLRAAYRDYNSPSERTMETGFRVVCALD
jgi:formylglycine-generating enzyme